MKTLKVALGLAIVSHIVKEHKGRVRVEDNIPTGVRFIVELNTSPMADGLTREESVVSTT